MTEKFHYSQTLSNNHVQMTIIVSRRPRLAGPFFLVRDKSVKQCVKDNHLFSVTATTPNLDRKRPKFYRRRPGCSRAACMTVLEIFLTTSANFDR